LITVGPVSLWLAFFVVIPLLYVFIMSFCSIDENYNVVFQFTLDNYRNLMDVNYLQIYAQSILIAFFATVICLVLGYPFAFLISRTFRSRKTFLYMLVIIPFWTNSLIRIYGWRTFLGASGWLNQTLMALHLTDSPMDFLFNRFATILGMAYVLFPFMVLPLYTAIEKLDPSQLEVSADLGARGGATFWNVVLPQTVSGVFSGCIMVFIPSLGYFYVADILGGGNSDVIGNLIERQFQSGNNWPFGAALSIILIAVTLLLVKLYQKCGGDMQSLGV
jgi:spermidine/putrescine transport system permease protein